MKEIKKNASFKSKQKNKDVKFNIDLNYSPEYDSFNIKVKQGEGFMSYSSNIEGMPLEVIQKLNEMLEEVLIKAGSETEMKEHKMFNGGDFQAGVYAEGGSIPNNYDGKYYGDIWDKEWTDEQKYHFLSDHKNEIGFDEEMYNESSLKRATKRMKSSQGNDVGFQLTNSEKLVKTKSSELPRYVYLALQKHIREGQYAEGGSLEAHGIKEGDTFIKTISGVIQKVRDKDGKIVYINLANGERDSQPPLPFDNGGQFDKKDTWQNLFENFGFKKGRSKYGLDVYSKRGYVGTVDNKQRNVELMFNNNVIYSGYSIQALLQSLENEFGKSKFDDGGEVTYFVNKDGIRVRSVAKPDKELSEKEWMAKNNESREARAYKRGGALIGNQKRIDMNHNGEIDAEDFKLLRSSMNGAWRNERKHVNHDEDYEIRYARKKPSRTGYKGKRNFETGGKVSFSEKSSAIARNFVGKRVEPKYQKEYGKTYDAKEAKEVGNKIAGAQKASYDAKAEKGAVVKKKVGNPNAGQAMLLAKKIRKDGEKWTDAVKRANAMMKNK